MSEGSDSWLSCRFSHFRQQSGLPAALRRGIGRSGKPEVAESGCSEGQELSQKWIPNGCACRVSAKVQNRHLPCFIVPQPGITGMSAFSANIQESTLFRPRLPGSIQLLSVLPYARARPTVKNPPSFLTESSRNGSPGALSGTNLSVEPRSVSSVHAQRRAASPC